MIYKLKLKDFAGRVAEMDNEEFRKKLPYPFLIEFECQPEYKKADAFETFADAHRLREISNLQFTISPGCQIIYMGKDPKSSHPRIITIGRSDSVDVTITHSTVSKRHAHIQICPEFERFALLDDRSTNCTFLNGKKIKPKTPYALYSTDFISFGEDLYFQFFTSPDLYKNLKEAGLI